MDIFITATIIAILVIEVRIAANAIVEATITMLLTCELCDKLNGKYNITVGTPEIDSPDRKSIIVNGSIFDPDNTQMGLIPFDLDWALDDEIIDIMLIDVDTRNTKVDSFDMSESTIVSMEAPVPTDMTIK
jgi:hypothetical protein